MATEVKFTIHYQDATENESTEEVRAIDMHVLDNGALCFFDVNKKMIRTYAPGWWRRAY